MKKVLSICLVLAMVLVMVPASVFAGQEPEEVFEVSEAYDGASNLEGVKYYYSDAYFFNSGVDYNPSLATMSLFTCETTRPNVTNDNTKEDVPCYTEDLLKALGFTDIEWNDDMRQHSDKDGIGVLCARKTIEHEGSSFTLVALVARYQGWTGEVASAYTVGKEGNAEGYEEASDEILRYLESYLKAHNITGYENKLWATGYSRAAGAINLAVGHIDYGKVLNGGWFKPENIYAYTFDCPNIVDSSKYDASSLKSIKNIHNINNPTNFVTYLLPSDWGFTRFGVDEEVILSDRTSANDAIFADVLAIAKLLNYSGNYTYTDNSGNAHFRFEKFQGKDLNITWESLKKTAIWNTGWEFENGRFYEAELIKDTDVTYVQFLNSFSSKLAKAIGSRGIYEQNYENGLRILFGNVYGTEAAALNRFWREFTKELKAQITSKGAKEIFLNAISFNKLFVKIIDTAMENAGLKSSDYKELSSAILTVSPMASHALWAMIAQGGLEEVVTFCYCASDMNQMNNSAVILSWLMYEDPNYNEETSGAVSESYEKGKANDVKVEVTKESEPLFDWLPVNISKYETSVEVTADAPIQSVRYKTWELGEYKESPQKSLIKSNKLLIEVVDVNGNVSYWRYNGTTVERQ